MAKHWRFHVTTSDEYAASAERQELDFLLVDGDHAEEQVRKGEALSATFAKYPKLYPFFMADMIAVGEETGKVGEMLGQVATYYETDVEERTKDLSTIIEPLLMLFIGVFVGIFAISMISPIYSLSSKI